MPLVYHVITDKNVGGGGRVLSSLLSHAENRFFSCRVLLPRGSLLTPYLRRKGILCEELDGVEDASFSFSSFLCFYRYLKHSPCDILVSHASLSARMAGRALGVPLLLAVKHCAVKGCAFPHLYRFFTHHTVAVSQNARELLLSSKIPTDALTVIENGVEAFFPPTFDQRKQARERFEISDGETAVGLSGRLTSVKGHRTAIEALAKALPFFPSLSLYFLGEGEEKESLLSFADTLGVTPRVHFLGFRENTLDFYHALDAHISCSVDSETASLSLAEGMKAGCPTFATDIPGNRARVAEGGLFFRVRDADALAALFLSLKEKKNRERYAAMARARAYELPSEKESAARFEELLLSLYKKRLHF